MPVHVEPRGPVSWVIIDRVEKGNSLDYEHAVALAEAVRGACGDPETRVVALRGAGDRFFSTGVDLEAVARVEGVEDSLRLMAEGLGGVCEAVVSCPKPVIAAVNGHAVGIGFELVVASDMAWAVRGARMGSPAAKWGMVPPASTTIAPLLAGYKQAAYIVLTGRLVTAEEAYRMGFLNGVVDTVDELVETVESVAGDVARLDPWAVATAKRLLSEARARLLTERGLLALTLSAARREARERARGFLESKAKGGGKS